MKLVLAGLSHKTAPVEVRECLAPPAEALGGALADLLDADGVREALMVSTCNRVEALAALEDDAPAEGLVDWLCRGRSLDADRIASCIYIYRDEEAVRHLFRVASSLDSLVVGEPQILGQIKEAYRTAAEAGASRTIINRLLHKTFQVAKRVRSETNIGGAAVSISFAAVELAKKIFDDLSGLTALLIGAGEMAELAAEHLIGGGVSRIMVANRTLERAVELAGRWNGRAVTLDDLPDVLGRADIVIASTGAVLPVIGYELARRALKRRRGRPVFFIDIAVPRDVDRKVGELDGAFVYDIDDLTEVVEANRASRADAAREAERIVAEEVVKFMAWLRGLAVVPTIAELSAKGEAIRQAELERTLKDLSHLDQADAEAIDRLTRALLKKVLHDPIIFLKEEGHAKSPETVRGQLALVRRLFGLENRES